MPDDPRDKVGPTLIGLYPDVQIDPILALAGVALVPEILRIRNRQQRDALALHLVKMRALLRAELAMTQRIVDRFIRDPIVGEHGERAELFRTGDHLVELLRRADHARLADQIEHLLVTQVAPPWTVRRLVGEFLDKTYMAIAGKTKAASYTDARVGAVPFVGEVLKLLGEPSEPSAIHAMLLAARHPKRKPKRKPNSAI